MPCGDGGLRGCSLLGRNPGFSRTRGLSDRAEDRQAECKEPKNDMVNAEATAEFISRPTTRFVEEQTQSTRTVAGSSDCGFFRLLKGRSQSMRRAEGPPSA